MLANRWAFISCLLLSLFQGIAFSTQLSSQSEPVYAEAVLAFNQKDYPAVLAQIEQGLKMDPNQEKFLELKALTLKEQGELNASAEIYRRILQIGKSEGKTKPQLASYLFELGVIHFHQKNYTAARANLSSAKELGFNIAASNFFLAMSAYEEKSWDDAREHFNEVIKGDAAVLRPTAQLYLAQISSQMGDGAGAVRNYARARTLARVQAGSEMSLQDTQLLAKHVIRTVDGQVRAFDKQILLANVGLLSGYDSNVLSTPIDSVDAGTKPASFKQTLQYGVAYATAPLSEWQFASTYKGNINYNFNQDTKSGEFFSHDLAVYLTRDPLLHTSYGFKAQGTGILQYQTELATNKGKFGAYSLGGSFGPYGKIELTKHWVLGADLFFAPVKYYGDDTTIESQRKSGWDQSLKIFITREEPHLYWNPGVYLTTGYTRTTGEEFRGKRIALELGNTFFLTEQLFVSTTAGVTHSAYTDRPGGNRIDDTLNGGVSSLYRFTKSLAGIADLQYTNNLTNSATYRYRRLVATLGGNYTF